MLVVLVQLCLAITTPEVPIAECRYENLEATPDVDAATVRPVIPSLNVREKGPGTEVIGKVKRDEWVVVRGRCGDWLEIGFGYGRGWIYGPLTCQPAPEVKLVMDRREAERDDAGQVWSVSTECARVSISGNHLGGLTDEEIAAAGFRRLRGEAEPVQAPKRWRVRDRPRYQRIYAATWLADLSMGHSIGRAVAGRTVTAVDGEPWREGMYQVRFDRQDEAFEVSDRADAARLNEAEKEGVWINGLALKEIKAEKGGKQ